MQLDFANRFSDVSYIFTHSRRASAAHTPSMQLQFQRRYLQLSRILLTLEETKQTTLCYTILHSPSLPQGRNLHKSSLTSLSFKARWVHAFTSHILQLSSPARLRGRTTPPILHLQVLSSPLKSPFYWLLSLLMKPLILTVWRQQQTDV